MFGAASDFVKGGSSISHAAQDDWQISSRTFTRSVIIDGVVKDKVTLVTASVNVPNLIPPSSCRTLMLLAVWITQ